MRTSALVLALWLFAPAPAWADRVDRVVAVIDAQLVLESEVRLEEQLVRLDKGASPFWTARGSAVERLIDAASVRVAAGQIVLYQPPDDEVRARREAIRAQFGGRGTWNEFLDIHGLTEDSILVVLKRRMVVERFLARNVQASPEDEAAWRSAAKELVAAIRERTRVRTIPEERG